MNKVLTWVVKQLMGRLDGYKTTLAVVLGVVSWLLSAPPVLASHIPPEVVTVLTHVRDILASIGITSASTLGAAGVVGAVGLSDKVSKIRLEQAAVTGTYSAQPGAPLGMPKNPGVIDVPVAPTGSAAGGERGTRVFGSH